jgi:hypothetical protein
VIRRLVVGDSVETGRIVGRPADIQTENICTNPSYDISKCHVLFLTIMRFCSITTCIST